MTCSNLSLWDPPPPGTQPAVVVPKELLWGLCETTRQFSNGVGGARSPSPERLLSQDSPTSPLVPLE